MKNFYYSIHGPKGEAYYGKFSHENIACILASYAQKWLVPVAKLGVIFYETKGAWIQGSYDYSDKVWRKNTGRDVRGNYGADRGGNINNKIITL